MNNNVLNIRTASSSDARRLAEIYCASWTAVYQDFMNEDILRGQANVDRREVFFQKMIQNRRFTVFAIEKNTTLVGLMIMQPGDADDVSQVAELVAIYIDPSHWRMGIGTFAIDYLKTEYRPNGSNVFDVVLWVFERNHKARSFYLKNGFTYTGQAEDVSLDADNIEMAVQYKLTCRR